MRSIRAGLDHGRAAEPLRTRPPHAEALHCFAALLLLSFALPTRAATLDDARWIWSAEAAKAPAQNAPAGLVFFRTAFAVTEQSPRRRGGADPHRG